MKPLVSVVVPVYNVAPYLDGCVQSLIDQELSDIEILLVDDGSTDGSGAMCDAWAGRDGRIRVIHKQNGGLSDARNIGIAAASADYIGFVDSDDKAAPSMYRVLYDAIVREGADISICGVYSCYSDHVNEPDEAGAFTLSGREALEETLSGKRLRVWVPLRLYARHVLGDAPFPVGRTYEDAFVVADVLLRARKVAVDMRPQYYYWHHEGTITSRPFGPSSMDIVDAYRHTYETVMRECPELWQEAEFRLYWSHFEVLDKMLLSKGGAVSEQRKQVVGFLRSHYRDIVGNPFVGRGRKLAMRALMVGVPFYACFARANARKYRINEG